MHILKTLFTFVVVGLLTICSSKAGHAQVGTPNYTFRNRAEVRAAALKNLRNLRASYDVIICAARQGMIRTALQTYQQELEKHRFSTDTIPVEVCASFALAHHFFVWREREWPEDTERSIRVPGPEAELPVQGYRDIALAKKPNAPEVLLAEALFQSYLQNGRLKAVQKMQKVVQLAPNWADGHYWYARVLGFYAISPPLQKQKAQQKHYGALMLQQLRRAQALDIALLPKAYMDYQYAYRFVDKPKQALAAFDSYVRANPGYPAEQDRIFGRGNFAYLRQYLVKEAEGASG